MKFIFWLYLTNSIFLIIHEIDSAYWKEWELFKLKGGVTGFLLLHFPLLFLVQYGLYLVSLQSFSGLIFSIILSLAGIMAFIIHFSFFAKGRTEFKTPVSIFILWSTLVISLVQFILTIISIMKI